MTIDSIFLSVALNWEMIVNVVDYKFFVYSDSFSDIIRLRICTLMVRQFVLILTNSILNDKNGSLEWKLMIVKIFYVLGRGEFQKFS